MFQGKNTSWLPVLRPHETQQTGNSFCPNYEKLYIISGARTSCSVEIITQLKMQPLCTRCLAAARQVMSIPGSGLLMSLPESRNILQLWSGSGRSATSQLERIQKNTEIVNESQRKSKNPWICSNKSWIILDFSWYVLGRRLTNYLYCWFYCFT